MGSSVLTAVEDDFVEVLQRMIADDAFGGRSQKKIVDEREHEERAHPVVRKALPHFGGEEIAQSDWVAEKRRFFD